MANRFQAHYEISTRLAMMSDRKLRALLKITAFGAGWGQNSVLEVNGAKVFAKLLPLTELELANAYSTKNLYRIPTWYNYGIGSAGFGAFRELAAHVKTTHWVEGGEFTAFPLLHHYRILAVDECPPPLPDLKQYVKDWNGAKSIENYMVARAKSQHVIVLFLEYLTPFTEWINQNPSKLTQMYRKAIKSVDFLHQHGVIHFDAHGLNWLTDGKDLFLSDYGLLLDQEFELSTAEQQFFSEHRYYDYAQVTATIADAVVLNYMTLAPNQQTLVNQEIGQSPSDFRPFMYALVREACSLHEKKLMNLPAVVRNFIQQYQPIIETKNEFFLKLSRGKKTADQYPTQKLKRLLKKLEVIG